MASSQLWHYQKNWWLFSSFNCLVTLQQQWQLVSSPIFIYIFLIWPFHLVSLVTNDHQKEDQVFFKVIDCNKQKKKKMQLKMKMGNLLSIFRFEILKKSLIIVWLFLKPYFEWPDNFESRERGWSKWVDEWVSKKRVQLIDYQ